LRRLVGSSPYLSIVGTFALSVPWNATQTGGEFGEATAGPDEPVVDAKARPRVGTGPEGGVDQPGFGREGGERGGRASFHELPHEVRSPRRRPVAEELRKGSRVEHPVFRDRLGVFRLLLHCFLIFVTVALDFDLILSWLLHGGANRANAWCASVSTWISLSSSVRTLNRTSKKILGRQYFAHAGNVERITQGSLLLKRTPRAPPSSIERFGGSEDHLPGSRSRRTFGAGTRSARAHQLLLLKTIRQGTAADPTKNNTRAEVGIGTPKTADGLIRCCQLSARRRINL